MYDSLLHLARRFGLYRMLPRGWAVTPMLCTDGGNIRRFMPQGIMISSKIFFRKLKSVLCLSIQKNTLLVICDGFQCSGINSITSLHYVTVQVHDLIDLFYSDLPLPASSESLGPSADRASPKQPIVVSKR
jgi:hypothetical protein